MAKKKRELVGAERERFVAGCAAQGHPEKLGKDLFDRIEPFADYGFPAAHACAYALIGYQTAYLKRHHPLEYMSALLTSVEGDKDNKPFYLNAARMMGIRVLPPDVNESAEHFAPAGEDVRYSWPRSATWARERSADHPGARRERPVRDRSATSARRSSRASCTRRSWRA
jgi:DNA polymerase-3 subunit alpha